MNKATKLTVATVLALGPVVAPVSAHAEKVEEMDSITIEQLVDYENVLDDEQAEVLKDDEDHEELLEESEVENNENVEADKEKEILIDDEDYEEQVEESEVKDNIEHPVVEKVYEEYQYEEDIKQFDEVEEESIEGKTLPASEQDINGDNFLEDRHVRNYVIEQLKINETLSWDYPEDGKVTESMIHDLTSLHIGSTYSVDNTVDLSFLEHTKNLTHLNLEGVKAKDWSPLTNSKNLNSFGLMGVRIDNLDFLQGLNLSELSIDSSIVKDWSSISEFTLRTFLTPYSNFNDLNLINSNESLTNLDIRHTEVKDIQSLVRFKNLEVLAVGGVVKQSDLDMIASIESLRSLNASESNLTDVSMFANTKLTEIILHHNEISDISALSHIETIKMHSQEITLDPVMMDDDATELTIEDPIKGTESMLMLDDDSLTMEGIKKGQSAVYFRFALYGPNGSIFVGLITVPLVWGDENIEEEFPEKDDVTPVAPNVKQAKFVEAASADKVAVEVELDGDVSEFDKVIVTLKNKETGHTVTSEATIRKEAVANGMSLAGLRVGFMTPFAADVVNERYVIEFDRTQFNPGEYEIASVSFVTTSGETIGGSELPSDGETGTVVVEDVEVEAPVKEEETSEVPTEPGTEEGTETEEEESAEVPAKPGTEEGTETEEEESAEVPAKPGTEEGTETEEEESAEVPTEPGTEEGTETEEEESAEVPAETGTETEEDDVEGATGQEGKDDELGSETPVSNEDDKKTEDNQTGRDVTEGVKETNTEVGTKATEDAIKQNEETDLEVTETVEDNESSKGDLVLNTDTSDRKETSEVKTNNKDSNKESLPQTGEAYPIWMTMLGITALLGALGLTVGRKKRKEA
ncbi:LPXTG cell wall anchor domain-containing protein [Alkalihalobacillus sp. FSL W8-0930]